MIALVDYFMYSNDLKFIKSKWPQYKNAMAFLQSKIDDNGLLNVTGVSGWGRSAPAGGYSTIGNMLMYGTFTSGSKLASWLGEQDLANQWTVAAGKLKDAVNSPQYNWEPTAGYVRISSNLIFIRSKVSQVIVPSKTIPLRRRYFQKMETAWPYFTEAPTLLTLQI